MTIGTDDTEPPAYRGPERRTQSQAPASCALAQDHDRMLHGHGGEAGWFERARKLEASVSAFDAKLDALLAECRAEKEAAVALAKDERRVPLWMHWGYFVAAIATVAVMLKRLLGGG